MNKYIIATGLVAFTLTSCNDFLDVQPEGNATTTTYFTNDQQAIDAIDAVYFELCNNDNAFSREFYWEQIAANDVVLGRNRDKCNPYGTFEYYGDMSDLPESYQRLYTNMARTNFIVYGLLTKSSRSSVETRTLGEAYFERAFCHFWVAHRYGTDELGVPFVRWEDYLPGEYDNSIPPQRESVMENYKLIIEDMENAMKYLPKFEDYSSAEQGRPHQAAALGYIAKAYAYWATWDETKWDDVIKCVDRLEKEYGRGLADTFEEIFSSDFADFWNREYLWSIPSNGGDYAGGCELSGAMYERGCWSRNYQGWGYFKPTNDIYEEMLKDGKDNLRLKYSILSYGDEFVHMGENVKFYSTTDDDSGFQVYKFQHALADPDCLSNGLANPGFGGYPTLRINFPLMRMAEMLLFRAEANLMKNKGAEAAKDINAIRKRSGLKELTGNATMKDLYHERRCELAFEYSNHLFDLKRWARSSNTEIKNLALAELNSRPSVRFYEDRANPSSDYTVGYYRSYTNKLPYKNDYMTFPYPSRQVINSNGALKQLKCWE